MRPEPGAGIVGGIGSEGRPSPLLRAVNFGVCPLAVTARSALGGVCCGADVGLIV